MLQAAVGNPSQHMREDQLGPTLDRCPVCDASHTLPRLSLQFSPDVILLRCGYCDAGFASRMPTPEALKEYYASYYHVPKYADLVQSNVHFSRPDRLARHIAQCLSLRRNRMANLRLFDFGGGDGTIAILLGQQILDAGESGRVEITVVDYPSPRPVHDSRLAICGVHGVESLDEAAFDVGIASASLEHVPDLRATLVRLLNAIRPGGRLYIRTPYFEPVIRLARLIGLNIDFGYPAHLYDLGEMFWRSMPEKVGKVGLAGRYFVHCSRPAIVESSWRSAPFRTLVAHMLKAPWWLIGGKYALVGGWEVVIERGRARIEAT
jgi:SAM-dependent methyltransferase